jgi:hypothetical protein
MEHGQRVKALLIGLTSPATAEDFPEHHDLLARELSSFGDHVPEIGVKLAMYEAFPDDEFFKLPRIGEMLEDFRNILATSEEFQADNSLESLDLALSRFAALGSMIDLAEVVRLVKNRDGSTAAIVTSSAALQVLNDGAVEYPELVPQLLKLGLDLSNPASGVFPRKSAGSMGTKGRTSVADRRAAAVAQRRAIPARQPSKPARARGNAIARQATGIEPSAALSAPDPDPIGDESHAAELNFQTSVVLDGIGPDPDRELTAAIDGDAIAIASDDGAIVRVVSIRNAMRLADSIVRHVRVMLIPGEGFAWVDNLTDPQRSSILVTYDLDSPHSKGLLEFPHQDGGLVQADVEQIGETFTARVYGFGVTDPGGFVAGEGLPDMARAKLAAASAVREFLNVQ